MGFTLEDSIGLQWAPISPKSPQWGLVSAVTQQGLLSLFTITDHWAQAVKRCL